jgi:hypothetical protein
MKTMHNCRGSITPMFDIQGEAAVTILEEIRILPDAWRQMIDSRHSAHDFITVQRPMNRVT